MKNIEKYQKLIAKGEVDALLLTSGELMRIMLGTMTELYLAQDVEHSLLAFRLANA